MAGAYGRKRGSVVIGSGTTLERTTVSTGDVTDVELEVLSGVTAGTSAASKAVVLSATSKIDSVDMTAWKVGGTAVTSTAVELNYLDLTTLGTGEASKAVVLDGSSDYTYPAAATIVFPSGATSEFSAGATLNVAGTFQIGGSSVDATANEIDLLDASAEDVYSEGLGLMRIAKADYNFAADGGAQSTIDLATTIPANTIIIGGYVDVQKTCISNGADGGSGAIQVQGAGDIVATETIANANQWDIGRRDIIPNGTGTSAVKVTSAVTIKLVIATQTWTAGEFSVVLFYLPARVDNA